MEVQTGIYGIVKASSLFPDPVSLAFVLVIFVVYFSLNKF